MTDGNNPPNNPPKNGRLGPKSEVDSSEGDPCLIQDDVKPKKLPFYEKHLSNLQEKTGLTRKWVLIVLGLVVIFAVSLLVNLGLLIGWPCIPHMVRYPICRRPECLRAASQIQENLNSSVSPCTDLWAAVCSKYSNDSIRPLDRAVWNQKQLIVQKEAERLRDVISTLELPLHTGTVEWKLKNFYESCLDVDNLGIDGARPLTRIISQLGGWYILRDWSEPEFDGMRLLHKLQVRYGVSPFFKIHVEPDPHVPNTHSIRISPSGLGLPDKDYYFRDSDDRISTAYTDYIRDVVISMSSTKNDAAKFGKDIFNYEKRIAEVTPDLVSVQNPITTYNAISLAELKQTANTIPFHDILQEMYPDVSLSENTEVVVTSLEYLSQLAQIISSTDRRTMNSYLIWTLVREYLPFLSDYYTAAMDSFNNDLFGISKVQKRWELCSRLVMKYMPLASEYHLEKAYPVSESTKSILNDTFKAILRVVEDKISKFDDTVLLRQHLEAKLSTLSFHVGLPESTKTTEFVKDYYKPLIILKLNLFEGVNNAIEFQRRIEAKMLQNKLPEGVILRETLKEVPSIRYIPSKNAIVMPRSLLVEPFFENGYPGPILYGRLGVEIAHAILSAVLPYGSLWTSDKKILSPFHMTVNESSRSIQSSIDCLSRRIFDLKLDLSTSRASETALSVLKDLSAVKIAYKGLLAALDAQNHIHYGGVEQYEESALFFVSFAQTQCSVATKEYQTYDHLLHFKLPSRSILDLAWKQLPDFRKAFDCAATTAAACGIF